MFSEHDGSRDMGGIVLDSAPACVSPELLVHSRAAALVAPVMIEAVRPGCVPGRSSRRLVIIEGV